ncbi:MAG: Asp-tRNA(Asn)/Glu-tRNA(Gln) amidotransferase subunit GatC [Armatimonadota bacterium]
MRLTTEDIESVARLSRLALTDQEIQTLTGHINRLLEHFEKLRELNTEDVEPTSHVIPVYNVFRKDEPSESIPVEEVLSNGPEVADNCFVVPRVVET